MKKTHRWLAVGALVVLAITLYNGWVLLPGFYVESYYKFDTPEGVKFQERDNWAIITFNNGEEIRISSSCHHYPFQTYSQLITEQCVIKVFLEGSKLKFSDHAKFVVEDIGWWKEPYPIGTLVEVFESEREWAQLDFRNTKHPNSIRLYIPDLTIEGRLIKVPMLTGDFVKDVSFDMCTIAPCF